jgi:hypothetical protein
MSRLRHSAPALVRSFQISQNQIFIIVEGFDFDRYVYGKLGALVCTARGATYQLISGRELPGKIGGKRRLLHFYRYMRRFAGLAIELGSRKRILLFFLDKDVDDICRQQHRSNHICYTTAYDLEGDIFLACDLVNVIGAALSADTQEVSRKLGPTDLLLLRLATKWFEWTSICLYVRLTRLRASSYGALSQINNPLNGPVDGNELAATLARLQIISGLSRHDFDMEFRAVQRLVRKLYARKLQNVVFKGKWYLTLLDAELKQVFAGAECNLQHLPARISSSMMSSLDWNGAWATRFKASLAYAVDESF